MSEDYFRDLDLETNGDEAHRAVWCFFESRKYLSSALHTEHLLAASCDTLVLSYIIDCRIVLPLIVYECVIVHNGAIL